MSRWFLMLALTVVVASTACESDDFAEGRRFQPAPTKEVEGTTHLRTPEGMGQVEVNSVVVPCSSCHTAHQASPRTRSQAAGVMHAELEVTHGDLNCVSCHAADNRDFLGLAEGSRIPFEDVNRLCAQCHGPQFRDYSRGSHGGMQGHWDLKSGDRERNVCVNCHDPHAPAFGQFEPVFKPKDRFLGAH